MVSEQRITSMLSCLVPLVAFFTTYSNQLKISVTTKDKVKLPLSSLYQNTNYLQDKCTSDNSLLKFVDYRTPRSTQKVISGTPMLFTIQDKTVYSIDSKFTFLKQGFSEEGATFAGEPIEQANQITEENISCSDMFISAQLKKVYAGCISTPAEGPRKLCVLSFSHDTGKYLNSSCLDTDTNHTVRFKLKIIASQVMMADGSNMNAILIRDQTKPFPYAILNDTNKWLGVFSEDETSSEKSNITALGFVEIFNSTSKVLAIQSVAILNSFLYVVGYQTGWLGSVTAQFCMINYETEPEKNLTMECKDTQDVVVEGNREIVFMKMMPNAYSPSKSTITFVRQLEVNKDYQISICPFPYAGSFECTSQLFTMNPNVYPLIVDVLWHYTTPKYETKPPNFVLLIDGAAPLFISPAFASTNYVNQLSWLTPEEQKGVHGHQNGIITLSGGLLTDRDLTSSPSVVEFDASTLEQAKTTVVKLNCLTPNKTPDSVQVSLEIEVQKYLEDFPIRLSRDGDPASESQALPNFAIYKGETMNIPISTVHWKGNNIQINKKSDPSATGIGISLMSSSTLELFKANTQEKLIFEPDRSYFDKDLIMSLDETNTVQVFRCWLATSTFLSDIVLRQRAECVQMEFEDEDKLVLTPAGRFTKCMATEPEESEGMVCIYKPDSEANTQVVVYSNAYGSPMVATDDLECVTLNENIHRNRGDILVSGLCKKNDKELKIWKSVVVSRKTEYAMSVVGENARVKNEMFCPISTKIAGSAYSKGSRLSVLSECREGDKTIYIFELTESLVMNSQTLILKSEGREDFKLVNGCFFRDELVLMAKDNNGKAMIWSADLRTNGKAEYDLSNTIRGSTRDGASSFHCIENQGVFIMTTKTQDNQLLEIFFGDKQADENTRSYSSEVLPQSPYRSSFGFLGGIVHSLVGAQAESNVVMRMVNLNTNTMLVKVDKIDAPSSLPITFKVCSNGKEQKEIISKIDILLPNPQPTINPSHLLTSIQAQGVNLENLVNIKGPFISASILGNLNSSVYLEQRYSTLPGKSIEIPKSSGPFQLHASKDSIALVQDKPLSSYASTFIFGFSTNRISYDFSIDKPLSPGFAFEELPSMKKGSEDGEIEDTSSFVIVSDSANMARSPSCFNFDIVCDNSTYSINIVDIGVGLCKLGRVAIERVNSNKTADFFHVMALNSITSSLHKVEVLVQDGSFKYSKLLATWNNIRDFELVKFTDKVYICALSASNSLRVNYFDWSQASDTPLVTDNLKFQIASLRTYVTDNQLVTVFDSNGVILYELSRTLPLDSQSKITSEYSYMKPTISGGRTAQMSPFSRITMSKSYISFPTPNATLIYKRIQAGGSEDVYTSIQGSIKGALITLSNGTELVASLSSSTDPDKLTLSLNAPGPLLMKPVSGTDIPTIDGQVMLFVLGYGNSNAATDLTASSSNNDPSRKKGSSLTTILVILLSVLLILGLGAMLYIYRHAIFKKGTQQIEESSPADYSNVHHTIGDPKEKSEIEGKDRTDNEL